MELEDNNLLLTKIEKQLKKPEEIQDDDADEIQEEIENQDIKYLNGQIERNKDMIKDLKAEFKQLRSQSKAKTGDLQQVNKDIDEIKGD